MKPVAPVTKYAMGPASSSVGCPQPYTRGPVAARLGRPGGARYQPPLKSILRCAALRRSLRLSSAHWSIDITKMKRREERDEEEAGVRDDLVVGRAVGALAAVVRERGRREEQEGDEDGGEDGRQALHPRRS